MTLYKLIRQVAPNNLGSNLEAKQQHSLLGIEWGTTWEHPGLLAELYFFNGSLKTS